MSKLHDLEEVYPDEGEVDFFTVMRVASRHAVRRLDLPGSYASSSERCGIQAVNSEVTG